MNNLYEENPARLLRRMCQKHVLLIALAGFFMVVGAGLNVVLPFATAGLIDSLIRHQPAREIIFVAASAAAGVLLAIVKFAQNYFTSSFTRVFGRDVSAEMFSKLQRTIVDYFRSKSPGEIVSRIRIDVDHAASILYIVVFPSMYGVGAIIVTIVSMLTANWKLALVAIATLPLWTIVSHSAGSKQAKHQRALSETTDRHNTIVAERLSLAGVIRAKAYDGYGADAAAYRGVMQQLYSISGLMIVNQGIAGIASGVIAALGPAMVLLYGAYLVNAGSLSIGVLTAFVALQASLYGPLSSLMSARVQLPQAHAILQRMCEVLNAPEEAGGNLEGRFDGTIDFRGVCYNRNARPVLQDVNIAIAPGEHVAIVGPSGSGKTTLAQMLLRFHLPDAGLLLLGGVPLGDWRVSSLRSNIAYVSQDHMVFTGTVAENLSYGRTDVTEEMMWEALECVHLAGYFRALPRELHTDVGVLGSALSGGERQRLSLARALLRRRPLCILDEATSEVDPAMEKAIISEVRNTLRSSTLIVITHRIFSVRDFDKIVLLDKSVPAVSGNYESLLALERFADMVGAVSQHRTERVENRLTLEEMK